MAEMTKSVMTLFFGDVRPAGAGLTRSSARICQELRPEDGVVDKTGSSPADAPKNKS